MSPPRTKVFYEAVRERGGEVILRWRALCGRCPTEVTMEGDDLDQAKAKMRKRGWKLGEEPYGHLCPACNNAAARTVGVALPAPTVSLKGKPSMTDTHAEAPRAPSKDDRRAIREALESRYDEDAGRWRENWSDRSVGASLNLPWAWVRDLREAMGLGPDRNEHAALQAAEVALCRQDVEAAREAVAKAVDRLAAAEGRLDRLELHAGYEPKGAAA